MCTCTHRALSAVALRAASGARASALRGDRGRRNGADCSHRSRRDWGNARGGIWRRHRRVGRGSCSRSSWRAARSHAEAAVPRSGPGWQRPAARVRDRPGRVLARSAPVASRTLGVSVGNRASRNTPPSRQWRRSQGPCRACRTCHSPGCEQRGSVPRVGLRVCCAPRLRQVPRLRMPGAPPDAPQSRRLHGSPFQRQAAAQAASEASQGRLQRGGRRDAVALRGAWDGPEWPRRWL